jgi:hypothetical protein
MQKTPKELEAFFFDRKNWKDTNNIKNIINTTPQEILKNMTVPFFGTNLAHLAAENGDVSIMKLLLDKIQDPDKTWINQSSTMEFTPLMLLFFKQSSNSTNMANIMLQHGADPNKMDSFGENALILAITNGTPNIIKTMIEKYGADPDIHRQGKPTPRELLIEKKLGYLVTKTAINNAITNFARDLMVLTQILIK